MHSKDLNKNKVEFRQEIDAILRGQSERHRPKDRFDFSRFVFPGARFAGVTFTQEAEFTGASFAQDADFRGATFTEEAHFYLATFIRDAEFAEATFTQEAHFGEVSFGRVANFARATFVRTADFREATFRRNANFFAVTFTQEASFVCANFARAASFSDASFTQNAYFLGATFAQEAHFSGAGFTQDADFRGARFAQSASFWGATFTEEAAFTDAALAAADFRQTRWLGEARFVGSRFAEIAEFEYDSVYKGGFRGAATFFEAVFGGKTYFGANRFAGGVDFARAQFADVALFSSLALLSGKPAEAEAAGGSTPAMERQESPEAAAEVGEERESPALPGPTAEPPPKLCFEDVFFERPERVRFDSFDLRRTSFAGTNLRQVRFHDVKWPRRRGSRAVVYDEIRPNPADPEAIRLLYRDLKASLEDARDWVVAGDFYYGEMEIRREEDYLKPLEERPRGGRAWLKRWQRRYFSPYALYWLAGGYGERPLRALGFFGLLVLVFGALFHQQIFLLDGQVLEPPSWPASLGHSLRVLTLQRSFYIEPSSNWAHRLTLLGSILGPVQLGVLAIALRRRFRR